MGRSNRPESLGRSAGARLTVMRLLVGEFKPRVQDGAAHALAGSFDLHVGQAHQGQAGQAVGQMHFHGDGGRLQPQKGTALDASQTHGAFLPP